MTEVLDPRLLLMPLPVWLVGTYDRRGRANMLPVSWCGICSSNPPCVSISLRPATYSFQSIMEQQAFTVNVPSVAHIEEVDFCGLVSGAHVDKFERCGLTPIESGVVRAPYISEIPMGVACRVIRKLRIGSHTQFIGEIVDVRILDEFADRQGRPDAQKLNPIMLSPSPLQYYGVGTQLGHAYEEGRRLLQHKE